ncbi:MAG: hypothetical protein HQ541_04890 [Mariniphaga sp.]|nr:hypothetical protein [Mariniphaga sp.]
MKVIESIRQRIKEYKINNSLPGKWKVFEYYTEPGEELINIKESQVKSENLVWNIGFDEDGTFHNSSNLEVAFVKEIEATTWSKSRNFVTLQDPEDFRKNTEFQFAFEKGNLKLLKKDDFGKIIVFAFFNRIS